MVGETKTRVRSGNARSCALTYNVSISQNIIINSSIFSENGLH